MRRFKNLVVGASIASVLIQPLGLVSAARAETVRMEYTDPDHSHAPSQVTVDEQSTTYEYDANGNLVNDGERVISWNQDNLPTKITKDNTEVNLYYDANGTRVAKEVKDKTTGNLISKTIYANQYYEQSVTSNQQSTPEPDAGGVGSGQAIKYYFANGRRIATNNQQQGTRYLYQDHLGSTVLATDFNSQKITDPLSYFPYGASVTSAYSLVPSAYLFTGQELDPESALYNYNARLYNPKTGAFISADSAGGGNRYSYAANNPMIFTDPSGHMDAVYDAGGGGGGGAGSQDADDVLQYEISGGNAYQPPGITATNPLTIGYDPILSEAEVNLLLPGTFEELMLGLAIFSITAPPTIISGIHWLQFLYAYYYYNYFYSAPSAPLHAPVGDTMWMESTSGYRELARGMTTESWEEVYQASKTMTKEWGVNVYEVSDEVFEAVMKDRGLPLSSGATYIFGEGSPGYMYMRSSRPAMEKTLMLGHEFKHFLYDASLGFPGGVTPTQMAITEFDAYRFYLANSHLLTPKALGIAEGESWYWYTEAERLLNNPR